MEIDVRKASPLPPAEDPGDMALINAYTLAPLDPDAVFTFSVDACDDQPDRDHERFPLASLEAMAKLFVGKTVICDHSWSASNQTARIYAAAVKQLSDGRNVLRLSAYMLRSEETNGTIAAITGGILKEVSVGCAIGKAVCNICGKEYGGCNHIKGVTYDGKRCIVELCDPIDAYELSFVAVPAQPLAGVTKSRRKSNRTLSAMEAVKVEIEIEKNKWR